MLRTHLPLAVAGLLVAGAAQAQTQPPSQPGTTEVEGVTIEGNVLREVITDFVEEVGVAQRDQNLARWDRRVCIGVVNMAPRFAQALVDQVSAVAMAVGLNPGDPGCRPNVLILADSNGDALAQALVDQDPQVFRPDIGNTNLGQAALERFRTSGAPVRWWQVTYTRTSQFGVTASRIRDSHEEAMGHVIIILDTSRIGSVSFASLADYVSMIALAQVDAQIDARAYDSVFNLFAENGSRTQRMTDWDLAYLRALYAMRGDAASPDRQQREIAFALRRELEAAAARDAEEAAPAE
ncbi:hypothetical protein [Brevundimonas sp.]|uniref:hypothetical protein n=1 Tax=Brevundimonas sp. TaxID=1871086 RepID=UPI0025F495BF|nr:hypothetical protein [Brevundimonas sp.]